jgi:isopenicillin N synthase-like dioxygenase
MSNEKLDKKNKIILISGISFASLTMLTAIVSACITPEPPDPKQLGDRQKIAYMASKEFTRLPEQEKINYMRKVGRSRSGYRQLNEQERQAVSKNTSQIRQKQMKERLNKFFEMSEEEQNAYLDERIARRKKWREARGARRSQQGSGNGSNSRADNRNSSNNNNNGANNNRSYNRSARRQSRLENTDSTTRAQMAEIRRRMREREKQTQGK